MLEIVLIFVVMILSLTGLTELLHRLWMLMLKPKTHAKRLMLILLDGEDAYRQFCYAKEHLRWCGRECCDRLLAVDCNLSESRAELCRSACGKDCDACFISYKELPDVIKKEIVV